jgi:hypothetical protein
MSCGPDDGNLGVNYTFRIVNTTGSTIQVTTGTSDQIMTGTGLSQVVLNGDEYECTRLAGISFGGALCSNVIEIRLNDNFNLGYRCFAFEDESQGLCFTEENQVYRINDPSIFFETDTRVYEYILQPDFFNNAFDLP